MSSRRMFQVNELLRQEISQIILTELNDPRLQLITITSVHASADLHYARVFFHVHGAEEVRSDSQHGLEGASGRIRHLLGQRIRRIKYIPELSFQYDDSLDYAEKINEVLEQIRHEHPEEASADEEA